MDKTAGNDIHEKGFSVGCAQNFDVNLFGIYSKLKITVAEYLAFSHHLWPLTMHSILFHRQILPVTRYSMVIICRRQGKKDINNNVIIRIIQIMVIMQ